MKETPISGLERAFVLQAISQKKRLDGRSFNNRRLLRINFGKEWGSCYVSLGETRVFAQVSCEIQQPKSTRPNEGLIFINVDISPMAASHVEPGKPSDACIEINRLLEKCIKESKCVDLESLCVVADEKVWALRVDITVLNMEGNISECASIAALAGLAHFKRPDVTSTGEGIIIHEFSEKDPIPTTLHHFPICLCYAIFNKGEHFVADPTEIEEKIAEAHLSVGMNGYRELCGLHLKGRALTNHNSVLQCVRKAGETAAEIVQSIKKSLQEDEEARKNGEEPGFDASVQKGRITSLLQDRIQVRIKTQDLHEAAGRMLQKLHQNKRKTWDEDGNEQVEEPMDQIVVPLGPNSAELLFKEERVPTTERDNSEDNELTMSQLPKKISPERLKSRKQKFESSWNNERLKSLRMESRSSDGTSKSVSKDSSEKQSQNEQNSLITLSDSDEEIGDELEVVKEVSKEEKERMKLQMVENIVLDDSEEEETTTLTHKELENPKLKQASTSLGGNEGGSREKKPKKKKKSKSQNVKADTTSRGWYPIKKW